MPLITFKGRAAESLWNHVKDHLDLLAFVHDLESRDQDKRRVAEVAMVAFMVTAAWGYNPVSDARYGSRFGRFLYLSRINRNIYRIAKTVSNVAVQVHRASGVETFYLGRACGFSAAIPLTATGFEHYCLNSKAMSELDECDIVPSPYEKNSIQFVLISGVVDFRSLPAYLEGIRLFPRTAHALLAGLAKQIGDFIPEVRLWHDRGVVYAETRSQHKLPTILCPLSGRGMGKELLETAGFLPEGDDARRNHVWTLDFEEINGRKIGDQYVKKLFKANRYIDRFRE
jgi:hypothetical protein